MIRMIRRTVYCMLAVLLAWTALPTARLAAQAETYDMPLYITVDIVNRITTVYRTEDNAVMRQMICTIGTDEFYTPSGTFYLPTPTGTEREEWFYFRMYGTYAKYATRIVNGVLFHSLLYTRKDESTLSQQSVRELGENTSHGCIRMREADAKYIADNCAAGTGVRIFRGAARDDELRELLLAESYTGEAGLSGMTYEQYLGMAEDADSLGRYSEGQAVLDLQYRLLSLGFFTGSITGVYTAATVKAVRAFQEANDMKTTGVATKEVLEAIYSDSAPLGALVTLETGMSGPLVTHLQNDLTALRLYSGDIDSVYDNEVRDAVRAFQGTFGYDYSDACLPEVQLAAKNAAKQLQDVFGGDNYTHTIETIDYDAARIATDVSVRLRTRPSTAAGYLEKLESGARMEVLERLPQDHGWSHVRSANYDGYIKDEYLGFYTYTETTITYTSPDGQIEVKLGQTLDEYLAGNVEAAATATLALTDVCFATVHTGSEDSRLNLRSTPDADGSIIAKLPNGLELTALEVGDTWTTVKYEGLTGYLRNDYLTYETRQMLLETQPEDEDGFGERIYASVHAENGADLLQYDSPDSEVTAHLGNGTRVEILSMTDDWAHVSYDAKEGYIQIEYLRVEDLPE